MCLFPLSRGTYQDHKSRQLQMVFSVTSLRLLWDCCLSTSSYCQRPSDEPILNLVLYSRGVKLLCTRGHISPVVAFKGLSIILRLYNCNYSLTRGKELGAAAWKKQGAGPDKTRWRAGFVPWALCLPPVFYRISLHYLLIVDFYSVPEAFEAKIQ